MALPPIRPARAGNGLAVRLATPLVAFLVLRIVADAQRDPLGAAEGAYLALLAGGLLAVVAALATRPATAAWAALLTTVAIVVLPDGSRGAVAVAMLVAALAIAAGERWRAGGGRLEPALAVPLALGAQLLFRGDLLLPPLLDARTVVSVALLPAVAGVASSLLAGAFGARRVLVVVATVAVLTPGWNLTTVATLVTLAAGMLVADPTHPRWLRIAAGLAIVAPAFWRPPAGLLIALAGLTLALLPRRPGASSSAAVAAVAAGSSPGRDRSGAVVGTGPLGGVFVAAMTAAVLVVTIFPALLPGSEARVWPSATTLLLAAALLLPALPVAALRPWRALAGVVLVVAAARLVADVAALAPGVALAALALPYGGPRARAGATSGASLGRLQLWWSGAVAAGTALLAAYPWQRAAPRDDALALAGLAPTPWTAALLALVVTAVGLAAGRLGAGLPDVDRSDAGHPGVDRSGTGRADVNVDRSDADRVFTNRRTAGRTIPTPGRSRAVDVGLAALFAAALAAAIVREAPRVLAIPLERPVTLSAERTGVARRLVDVPATSSVTIDTSLARGIELPPGTLVGVVLLLDGERQPLARWSLRAGADTAEWAIDRADVAARVRAPPPWLATVSPDGSFFVRRFRSRFAAETPVDAVWVVVRRSSRLPEPVELFVHRLEIRR